MRACAAACLRLGWAGPAAPTPLAPARCFAALLPSRLAGLLGEGVGRRRLAAAGGAGCPRAFAGGGGGAAGWAALPGRCCGAVGAASLLVPAAGAPAGQGARRFALGGAGGGLGASSGYR